MLEQRLSIDLRDNSGSLTIRSLNGSIVELQGLAQELALRPTIQTQGTITYNLPPDEDPPPSA